MFTILIGFLSGITQPIQTSINGKLKLSTGSALRATQLSMAISFCLMIILLLVTGTGFTLPITEIAKEPFWIWCGGILGLLVMVLSILVFAKLGSVQAAILPASGQIIMGLITDHFGLFNSNIRLLSPVRLLGAFLVIAGLVIVTRARFSKISVSSDKLSFGTTMFYQFLGLAAGMCSASQMAINARLKVITGAVLSANFFNSIMCNLTTFIVVTILVLIKKEQHLHLTSKKPVWMWTGGIFGVIFVLGSIVATQALGTGLAMTLSLIGICVGGLLIDQFGLFSAAKKPASFPKILGIAIMIAGAAMIRLL